MHSSSLTAAAAIARAAAPATALEGAAQVRWTSTAPSANVTKSAAAAEAAPLTTSVTEMTVSATAAREAVSADAAADSDELVTDSEVGGRPVQDCTAPMQVGASPQCCVITVQLKAMSATYLCRGVHFRERSLENTVLWPRMMTGVVMNLLFACSV